jgi:peptidyl-tRNA hydrolase, PTH1 family
MKLIVGLGNPGYKYEKTKHNLGFRIIDKLCEKLSLSQQVNFKFKGEYMFKVIDQEKIFFLKPLTYMNLSGVCVKAFIDYFKIDLEDVLVIFDDISFDLGLIKFKFNGSGGGHKGIENIIQNLKTKNFKRLKIGINTVERKNFLLEKYVLLPFSEQEETKLKLVFKQAVSAILNWIKDDSINFSNIINN